MLFGSPGTLVENNTIWIENVRSAEFVKLEDKAMLSHRIQNTLLGGINMVDYEPWKGNYTNTVVRNNTIRGGFATSSELPGEKDGTNTNDVIIKYVLSTVRCSKRMCSPPSPPGSALPSGPAPGSATSTAATSATRARC